jgi:cytochrome c oxidase subunit IV
MAHHVVPAKTYVGIWAALIGLTILTALASRVELGPFNIVVALLIATTKASLVVLIFMGVKYISQKMTVVVLVAGLFWFLILLVLGFTDYVSRPWN